MSNNSTNNDNDKRSIYMYIYILDSLVLAWLPAKVASILAKPQRGSCRLTKRFRVWGSGFGRFRVNEDFPDILAI